MYLGDQSLVLDDDRPDWTGPALIAERVAPGATGRWISPLCRWGGSSVRPSASSGTSTTLALQLTRLVRLVGFFEHSPVLPTALEINGIGRLAKYGADFLVAHGWSNGEQLLEGHQLRG